MRNSRKTAAAVAALLSIGLIAAACGGDDDDAGETTTTEAGAATTAGGGATTTAGGATTTAAAGQQGGTITVRRRAGVRLLQHQHRAAATRCKNTRRAERRSSRRPSTSTTRPSSSWTSTLMESVELTSEDPQVVVYKVEPDAAWDDGDPIDCDDFYLQWISSQRRRSKAGRRRGDARCSIPRARRATRTSSPSSARPTARRSPPTSPRRSPTGSPCSVSRPRAGPHRRGPERRRRHRRPPTTARSPPTSRRWRRSGTRASSAPAERSSPTSCSRVARTSWPTGSPGQSLTLERNDAYWGTPANADEIVFRLIADATAQPQALQNEEVQIISPQPNPDLLAQLEGIDGVTVETTSARSPTSTSTSTSSDPIFQDKAVREAFAYCVAAPGDRRHAHQAPEPECRHPQQPALLPLPGGLRRRHRAASTTRSTSPRPRKCSRPPAGRCRVTCTPRAT